MIFFSGTIFVLKTSLLNFGLLKSAIFFHIFFVIAEGRIDTLIGNFQKILMFGMIALLT
jgi:hypothetical protein